MTLSIKHRWLPPDIATPVVLFAIEALTFDTFQPRPESRRRKARVHLSSSASRYFLNIEDGCPAALPMGTSLPDRVMRSIAEQLRGRYTVETFPTGGQKLTLWIPLDSSAAPNEPSHGASVHNLLAFSRSRQA